MVAPHTPGSLLTVIFSGHVITGAIRSTMVKVAEVEEEFPQASVTVKVTNAEPVVPQL